MIKIKSCYSWYNIFVDNTMILTHKTQKEIDEILLLLHTTNTPYDMDLRG